MWQLIEAKGRIVSCEADAKTLVRKVEHFKKELETKRQSAKTAGKEYQALEVSFCMKKSYVCMHACACLCVRT
jgi:hypothetical protein